MRRSGLDGYVLHARAARPGRAVRTLLTVSLALLAALLVVFTAVAVKSRVEQKSLMRAAAAQARANAGASFAGYLAEGDWPLAVVNAANPLADDFAVTLSKTADGFAFDARAYDALCALIRAAEEAGVELDIARAYVSAQASWDAYLERVAYYTARGCAQAMAETLAEKTAGAPGTDEFSLGLSVAFESGADFEASNACAWLLKNAARYGFVLRYPEDKADMTGSAYAPEIWRYVGPEAAKVMRRENLCLEEYVVYRQLARDAQ